MNTTRFEVERFDYLSSKTFEQVIAALEQQVPRADLPKLSQLVVLQAPAGEIEKAVQAMVGNLGFMHFAKLDQGPLVSLLGKRKRLTVYLLGNPVLANRMFEHRPQVRLYAPLRASVYEDDLGVAISPTTAHRPCFSSSTRKTSPPSHGCWMSAWRSLRKL